MVEDFERIYSEYFDVIYHYVLSLCLNESLAEEITQESFFKALKSIDRFRGDCKVNVWLCQIAKNIYCTESKRNARQVDYPLELIPSEESIEKDLLVKEEWIDGIDLLTYVEDYGSFKEKEVIEIIINRQSISDNQFLISKI